MGSETTVTMDEMFDQLRKTIRALATVAGELQRQRSDQRDSINAEFRELQGLVDSTARRVTSIVEGAKSEIRQSAEQSLDKSLAPAVDRVVQKCQAAENSVQQSTNRLAQASQMLVDGATKKVRIASFVMGAMALAVLGSMAFSYLAMSKVGQDVERRRAEISYLDLVNQADIAPCGDRRLCAKLDDKAQKVAGDKQYRVIAARGQ